MRLFFISSMLVLATLVWGDWANDHPTWRRDGARYRARAESILVARCDSLRAESQRPEVRARELSLQARIMAFDADTGVAARDARAAAARIVAIRKEGARVRSELRNTEARLWSVETSTRYRALRALLDATQDQYAEATGTWPPDAERVRAIEAREDSLSALIATVARPADALLAAMDSLREEEKRCREVRDRWQAPRDSLVAERDRMAAPLVRAEAALAKVRARPVAIRELTLSDGSEVARCPTCHGDLRDEPPAHPPLAAAAAFLDTPCTVCHGGDGRALDRKHAHRDLVTTVQGGAPNAYSLQARIDALGSPGAATRREAMEELHRITGIVPAGGGDRPEAWLEWWAYARRYFETPPPAGDSIPGMDPWTYSTRGRPLQYVGSKQCLSCHLATHREHCERWLATKGRTFERLKGEARPERCYACHTTGYDPATGRYAERGVTCEACHGPGERYSAMMFAAVDLNGRGDTAASRALLDESARLARQAVAAHLVETGFGPTNICVSCHQPRMHADGGPSELEHAATMKRLFEAGDGE